MEDPRAGTSGPTTKGAFGSSCMGSSDRQRRLLQEVGSGKEGGGCQPAPAPDQKREQQRRGADSSNQITFLTRYVPQKQCAKALSSTPRGALLAVSEVSAQISEFSFFFGLWRFENPVLEQFRGRHPFKTIFFLLRNASNFKIDPKDDCPNQFLK